MHRRRQRPPRRARAAGPRRGRSTVSALSHLNSQIDEGVEREIDPHAENHYPNPKLRAADIQSGWRAGSVCPVCASVH